jgi:hypothetical protein
VRRNATRITAFTGLGLIGFRASFTRSTTFSLTSFQVRSAGVFRVDVVHLIDLWKAWSLPQGKKTVSHSRDFTFHHCCEQQSDEQRSSSFHYHDPLGKKCDFTFKGW